VSTGIEQPKENWTRFPNCILDNLDRYNGNELKVLAFMVRKTMGWHGSEPNYMFAAEYVAKRLDMSEKTARTAIDGLEKSGSIKNVGREGKAGVKLYVVNWTRPVKITDRPEPSRPVKITGDARQNLPTVLETNHKETSIAAAACMPNTSFGKETKTKVKKTIDLSPIEPVLKILRETDKNADKSISLNLRNMIRNEIELNGEEFVCNAVRGRMVQSKASGKPLYLSTFFDPDNAEWRSDCARVGEAAQNAPQRQTEGFKSTLPDFSDIKLDDAPIDEEAWQTLTGSKK